MVSTTHTRSKVGALFLCLFWSLVVAHGFQIQFTATSPKAATRRRRISLSSSSLASSKQNIVDVEFERSPDPEEDFSRSTNQKKKKRTKKSNKKSSKKGFGQKEEDDDEDKEWKSLFDLSLESGDPRWKEARIPFVDTIQSSVIEGTLAFVVELEGVQYGIATPSDAAVAITLEDCKTGTVTNYSPDDPDSEEIMEIMATRLVEHVGADLALKRTPRVLTVQGDLDQYTNNWQNEILSTPYSTQELLDTDDDEEEENLEDELKFFHDFMKKELGEEEYTKTMSEPVTAEDIGDEMMELFDLPGFGELRDDIQGIQDVFLDSLEKEEDPIQATLDNLGGDPLDHDGAALKLISYNFKDDGTSYSLVKLLKPYTLVGRRLVIEGEEEEEGSSSPLQFELLTPQEEKLVIPKIEEVCRKDLKDAGLNLSP